MVVHPGDASFADAAVMGVSWFVALAVGAHDVGGQGWFVDAGDGRQGDRTRVGKGRLGVARQGQRTHRAVPHGYPMGHVVLLSQEGHRDGSVN